MGLTDISPIVPRRKKAEPEYRLRVFHAIDERSAKPVLVIAVETIKEFVNFNYEVLLQEQRGENAIHLKILGLHTPASVMPGVGPARGFCVYPLLEGPLVVDITKPDGGTNRFEFRIDKRSVAVRMIPEQPFVVFSPDPIPFQ